MNNVVIRGKQGVAGILEHYPWFESSPACECGKVGCITAVLSDRSLLEQAKNMHEELHIQDINDLVTYSKNYPDIKQLLKKRAFKAGELIAKLAVLHDPARIVLSGSLLIDGYQQMEWVQESFKNIMNPVNGKYAYIENPTSRYSNVPFTLIGAGTIAINKSLSSSLLLKKDPTTNSTKGTVAYLPL